MNMYIHYNTLIHLCICTYICYDSQPSASTFFTVFSSYTYICMCMCVCVCVCMCVCVYVCKYIHMCMSWRLCACVYLCIYVCTVFGSYTYTYTYIHTHTHLHIRHQSKLTHIHPLQYTHTHIYIYMYMYYDCRPPESAFSTDVTSAASCRNSSRTSSDTCSPPEEYIRENIYLT